MKATRTLLTWTAASVFALSFSGYGDAMNVLCQPTASAASINGGVQQAKPEAPVTNPTLTAAESIQLIVKSLGLSLDHIRFFKKPEASDYFSGVKNDAVYADALIIAAHNGFDLKHDLNPDQPWTKEEFIHQLMLVLQQHANMPLINVVPVPFADQDQVDPLYQGTIQRAIALGIVTLDKDGKLHPKDAVTQNDAETVIQQAVAYEKAHLAPELGQ